MNTTEQHVIEQPLAAHPTSANRAKPRTTKNVVAFFGLLGFTGVALAAIGLVPRSGQTAELAATTQAVADARRIVAVASPSSEGAAYELRLPGSTAALQETTIYARTSGYVKSFRADIGDRVTAGQLLAEIESPEVDEQLNEARATLVQNTANLALASQRLERVKSLYAQQAAGRGELDDLTAQHNSATATVKVSAAVVSRLEKEQLFQKVLAPFDGVVTQRHVDLGSLVTAGSSAGVTPLFKIEQTQVLKVFVDAPQTAAPSMTVGQTVQVEVREYPGRSFEGKIVRTAGSIDPQTRTLKTEIHLPNPKGELLAGSYAQAKINVQDSRKPVRIPAATLVVDATGTHVVAVGSDNIARRKPITLGRDFGKDVEVIGGLAGNERMIVSPRDDLRDGDVVAVR